MEKIKTENEFSRVKNDIELNTQEIDSLWKRDTKLV